MRSFIKMAVLTALICSTATTVQAHPGSKILTTGSDDRTAMTDGMTYEDVNGVHIFRGRPAMADEAIPASPGSMRKEIEIEISARQALRRPRQLRTQGFYSGGGYPSRRYTHGFYSGR